MALVNIYVIPFRVSNKYSDANSLTYKCVVNSRTLCFDRTFGLAFDCLHG